MTRPALSFVVRFFEYLTDSSPSVRLRFWFVLTGVLLPVAAIVTTVLNGGNLVPLLYQADEPWAFASVLLGWPCLSVMIPLILFCMAGMTCYSVWPSSARYLAVRSAVFAGGFLSTVYLVVAIIAQAPLTLIFAAMVVVVLLPVTFVVAKIYSHWRRFSIAQLLLLTAVAGIALATVSYLRRESNDLRWVTEMLATFFFVTLVATPTLNCLSYLLASAKIFRSKEDKLPVGIPIRVALWLAIAGGWYVSWKAAIDLMVDEYSRLPSNRNCYISNAAAHGHPFLVGTRWHNGIGTLRGNRPVTTLQMQRCKFVEICLVTASPAIHGCVRNIYDQVGPPLANFCCRSVWFADFSYVLFKPVEWIAVALRVALRIRPEQIRRLYSDDATDE